jgi:hypothetical protein
MYLLALKDKVSVEIVGCLDSTLANLVPKTNISARVRPTQTYVPVHSVATRVRWYMIGGDTFVCTAV